MTTPIAPTAIAGLQAWWDASQNQFSDAAATVPATYGGTVQSLVTRDGSALKAVTGGGATYLLSGGAYDGQAAPGIYMGMSGGGLPTSLNVTRPYTLVVVGTPGVNAAGSSRFPYVGSSGSPWVTCAADFGGVVYTGGVAMDDTFIPPFTVRHVFIVTCNLSGTVVWVDGVNRTTNGSVAGDWGMPILGGMSGLNTEFGCFQHLCIYNNVISNANIAGLFAYFATTPLNVIVDGNSLSVGFSVGANGAWPFIMANTLAPSAPLNVIGNVAVSGDTTPQRITAAPTKVDPLYDSSATLNVVVMWEIINDMLSPSSSTAAQAYAHYQTYGNARKAANPGMKVVFGDLMNNVNVANGPVNALLAADFTVATTSPFVWLAGPGVTYGDMLITFSTVNHLTDHTNLTYFQSDGLHLTLAGYTVVAGAIQTALGILAAPQVASFCGLGSSVFQPTHVPLSVAQIAGYYD